MMRNQKNLTANEKTILKHLHDNGRALKAYEILDLVRSEGIRAPSQVYRALDSLVSNGFVHRLESLSAFIACAHDHGKKQDTMGMEDAVAFAICQNCGTVEEYDLPGEFKALRIACKKNKFSASHMTVEISGCCLRCETQALEV
ncbi:MAG: hypothetical protein CBB68_00365 [Rhodospirillaceae bacterium TMED8]|nr:hypothetical protein [Magnetovibrio sp.]OUT53341.1 MAG: hypothetical protein CBB68_00365 [Rhodospirillaceae bacterium TMED8]|tara:strand:+ start:121 stop:552 length:432 start_codon:yes stop_codon:yes gene_type:complete